MKKKKSIKAENLERKIINALRQVFLRSRLRYSAIKNARVERGAYECNDCKGLFKANELRVDHIAPVVDSFIGFYSWNVYIERMFCDESGLQALCDNCHDIKTASENKIRREDKASRPRLG